MPRIRWIQAIIAFILGAVLGQRFVHMHPVSSTRADNGYA